MGLEKTYEWQEKNIARLISKLHYEYLDYCTKNDSLDRPSNSALIVLECISSVDKVHDIDGAIKYIKRSRDYSDLNNMDENFVYALKKDNVNISALAEAASLKSGTVYMQHELALTEFIIKSSKYSSKNFIISAPKMVVEAIDSNKTNLSVYDLNENELKIIENKLENIGLLEDEEEENEA